METPGPSTASLTSHPGGAASCCRWGNSARTPSCPHLGPWAGLGGSACPHFLRLVGCPPEPSTCSQETLLSALPPRATRSLPELRRPFPEGEGECGPFFASVLAPPSLAHSRCSRSTWWVTTSQEQKIGSRPTPCQAWLSSPSFFLCDHEHIAPSPHSPQFPHEQGGALLTPIPVLMDCTLPPYEPAPGT